MVLSGMTSSTCLKEFDFLARRRCPVRILLVDDDAFSRKLMGFYLKPLGAEVELLSSGEDCLRSVAAQAPDLILMDCQMPQMDGYETVRRLRASQFSGVILALTGNSDEETVQRCGEAGMNGHMSKPVDAATLRARIQEALGTEASAPEPEVPSEDPLARARSIAASAGNPALMVRLVASFLKSADESMLELTNAAARQDAAGVSAAAHRLRGSSGSFGATSLSHAAGQLEDSLQVQSLQQCDALLVRLQSLWVPLREHLASSNSGGSP